MTQKTFTEVAKNAVLGGLYAAGAKACLDSTVVLVRKVPAQPKFVNGHFGKIDGMTCTDGALALAVVGTYFARKAYQHLVR